MTPISQGVLEGGAVAQWTADRGNMTHITHPPAKVHQVDHTEQEEEGEAVECHLLVTVDLRQAVGDQRNMTTIMLRRSECGTICHHPDKSDVKEEEMLRSQSSRMIEY